MIAVLATACLVLTVLFFSLQPDGGFLELDDLREGQLEAAGAMVLAVTAAVVLGRFRRHGSRRMLVVAAGLLALAAENVFAAIAIPTVDSLAESHFATWTAAGSAAVGAALLGLASTMTDRTVVHRGRAVALVLSATAGLLAVIAAGSWAIGPSLPGAFDAIPRELEGLALIAEHPLLFLFEVAIAVAFALAAVRFHSLAAFDDGLMRWLSFASLLAAAAFANYALFPSQFTEMLYSGDMLLLASLATLLVGAILEITGTEAALVRAAVASERQRVAGELRAGVAQELALVSTQTQWMASRPEDHHRVEELAQSVERAVDESRGAIASLGRPVDESVARAVAHAALDAGDRFGARVDLRLAESAMVSREWREALVRTTRESVTMAVRQHGAATVTIELLDGRRVQLRIADDGRRQRSERGAVDDVALDVLRERAEALGGTFRIEEGPGAGTVLEVTLP